VSQEAGYPWGVAESLQGLADVAYMRGRCDGATALHLQSMGLSQGLGGPSTTRLVAPLPGPGGMVRGRVWTSSGAVYGITGCLKWFGGAAAAHGDHERAVRLFGAAEALQDPITGPPLPDERVQCEALAAAAGVALGEARFATT
jgi:hypothetical protein